MKIQSSLLSSATALLPFLLLGTQALASEAGNPSITDGMIAYSSKTALPSGSTDNAVCPVSGSSCASGPMASTTEQLEKFNNLKNDYLDKVDSDWVELKSAERHLKAELASKDIDKDKALKMQSKINTLKGNLANARLDYQIDKINLMTSEQRDMFRRHMLLKSLFGHHHFFHHHFSSGKLGPRAESLESGPNLGFQTIEVPLSPTASDSIEEIGTTF